LDSSEERHPLKTRVKRVVFGAPRDLSDRSIFHRITLIPFLAWVGLGADGLSSSAYGPEEAFRTLGEHKYLALALAGMMVGTVLVISRAYSRIIEEFPHGGGGYVVATKLLGERAGVISGCALLVDYVFTIAVSIAAAGDALFSFLPADPGWKIWVEAVLILLLTTLNIRGVRESVLVLLPVFVLFIVTHVVLILAGVIVKLPEGLEVARSVREQFEGGAATIGLGGMILLFFHAYSFGGGTYTGIEAVSNGLPIMREPRVETGKRTMLYMALSLAFTASGLLLCYLLWHIEYVPGKTMNAVLVERLTRDIPGGIAFVVATLITEGALLVVAAQAGFIDGPRVLANMAVDSWMPRRFAALSERLTTRNGVVLMGAGALAALFGTLGDVRQLVVIYSINVFLTFSLSTFAMLRSWLSARRRRPKWKRRVTLFAAAFALCATILVITLVEKLPHGGWVTLVITGAVVAVAFAIRRHYRTVAAKLQASYGGLEELPPEQGPRPGPPDPNQRTAALLVAGYGGVGVHTVYSILRLFPNDFKNFVFLSVGVIDSGAFKGDEEIDALKTRTEAMLARYVELMHRLGIAATYRLSIGTDVVAEAEKLALGLWEEFPKTTFFIGKVIFQREGWHHRLLHNETAFAVQKRLEWAGKPMVILPARVH
jgi:amino acid transporter